jgi:hypothetical protein
MHRRVVTRLAIALIGAACVISAQAGKVRPPDDDEEMVPTGKGRGERIFDAQAHRQAQTSGQNGILYHGGPVMLNTPNVYVIWYGSWTGNSATSILTNLVSSIGGSPYFGITTTYYDSANRHVSGKATFAGQFASGYTKGTSLSDAQVQQVVADAIASNNLPGDTNGVYFVLTSADVNESSGFCTQYCGWHSNGTIAGLDIKYAFVGNPDRCPSACEAQTTRSPNGNPGADGMASIIAHELEESTTDPDLNAWYDKRGFESADKCAWTFGTMSTASNGSKYNMTLGGKRYLIQQNWVNAAGGYCATKYP